MAQEEVEDPTLPIPYWLLLVLPAPELAASGAAAPPPSTPPAVAARPGAPAARSSETHDPPPAAAEAAASAPARPASTERASAAAPSAERDAAEREARERIAECDRLRAAARAAGLDDAPVARAFREDLERLADAGSLHATAWLLRAPARGGASADERASARRRALHERAAAAAAEHPWLLAEEAGVLAALRADAAALGPDAAGDLARRFAAAARTDAARDAARLAEAEAALAEAADPGARGRALALLDGLAARRGATPAAAEAADRAWRLRHLRAGAPAPALVARDAEGNELRLEDLRGRRVVVHVWTADASGAASPLRARRDDLEAWARWAERAADADVVLVGVALGVDAPTFRRLRAEHGVDWTTVLVPPDAREVPWRLRRAPAVFAVDEAGVLRLALRGADAAGVPPSLDAWLSGRAADQGEVRRGR